MIRSFGDAATEDLFHGRNTARARRFPAELAAAMLRRLDAVHHAQAIADLRSPPANRLERLRGDLASYWSVRVNDQWRVVFRWDGRHATDVRLTDYH